MRKKTSIKFMATIIAFTVTLAIAQFYFKMDVIGYLKKVRSIVQQGKSAIWITKNCEVENRKSFIWFGSKLVKFKGDGVKGKLNLDDRELTFRIRTTTSYFISNSDVIIEGSEKNGFHFFTTDTAIEGWLDVKSNKLKLKIKMSVISAE